MIRRFLLFMICVGVVLPVHAQRFDVLQLLTSSDFDSLESHFTEVQLRFERGELPEVDLVDAYRPFYQRKDTLSPYFKRWVEQKPAFYVALLSRGIYYRKLGELNRGRRYIANTRPEKIEYMIGMFRLAKADLQESLKLKGSLYIAALHLLNIAQFEGDRSAARTNLDLANRLQPDNFMARARYLIQLEPRWGGSYKQMDMFIAECRTAGVPQSRLNLLEAIKLNDVGSVHQERGRTQLAHAAYKKALMLAKDAGTRFRRDYIDAAARICATPDHSTQEHCK